MVDNIKPASLTVCQAVAPKSVSSSSENVDNDARHLTDSTLTASEVGRVQNPPTSNAFLQVFIKIPYKTLTGNIVIVVTRAREFCAIRFFFKKFKYS